MEHNSSEPYTPCIGILVVEIPSRLIEIYGRQWYSYISAEFPKWLESGGAFTVPIWIGRERAYYQHMMSLVNGILLPGGEIPLTQDKSEITKEYIESAYQIFDLAMEMNLAGKYFPVWGTCLGFQLHLMRAAKDTKMRTPCAYDKTSQRLMLNEDFRKSKILKELPTNLEEGIKQVYFSSYYHKFFVSTEAFESLGLSKCYQILATSDHEESSKTIVMFVEHRCLPIFGSQFQPERVTIEPDMDTCSFSYSRICIEIGLYLANTFVELCRQNNNRFANTEQISRHLIYNWPVTFAGKCNEFSWLQAYFFEKNVNYPRNKMEDVPCGCKD